jgi:hypothetical protein
MKLLKWYWSLIFNREATQNAANGFPNKTLYLKKKQVTHGNAELACFLAWNKQNVQN